MKRLSVQDSMELGWLAAWSYETGRQDDQLTNGIPCLRMPSVGQFICQEEPYFSEDLKRADNQATAMREAEQKY